MSAKNILCRVCKVELNDENWYPSCRKIKSHICKECDVKQKRLWQKANPKKRKAIWTKYTRKQGYHPFSENNECSQFLGIHVAERVLSRVFKDVKRMPYGNRGYDFICNKGKKIDVKSSCLRKDGKSWRWGFDIKHNTIADYFLCLAFDNQVDLNPLHVWLIPGDAVNHLVTATISLGTVVKWDAYALDITKITNCCDAMKQIKPLDR